MRILSILLVSLMAPALAANDAVGVLLVADGKQLGTAVCVTPQGHFLTAAEALKGAKTAKIVIAPGTGAQQILPATLANLQSDVGVAMLKVESETPLTALPIAAPDGLKAGSKLRAIAANGAGSYESAEDLPELEPVEGTVTNVTQLGERIGAIQWQAALKTGASGGPVLDKEGRLIGLISTKLANLGIQLVIPSTVFEAIELKPMLTVAADPIPLAEIAKPRVLQARIAFPGVEPEAFDLSLAIGAPGQAKRKIPFTVKAGMHEASFVPVPNDGEFKRLRVIVVLKDGSVRGLILDQTVMVGEEELSLSQIAGWHRSSGEFILHGGRSLQGQWKVSLKVDVDPIAITIPPEMVQAIELAPPEALAALDY
jgi:hypothetical protein